MEHPISRSIAEKEQGFLLGFSQDLHQMQLLLDHHKLPSLQNRKL